VNEALKEGSGGLTASRAGLNLRSLLVVAEVAMALVLLVGAGLLFNSFIHLNRVDVGFETDNLMTLEIKLGPTFTDKQRTQFSQDLLDRTRSIPGIKDVAVGIGFPLVYYGDGRCCWSDAVRVPSQENSGEPTHAIVNPISPNYFRVLGAAVVQGREFQSGDEASDPIPAIINETVAGRLFGDANVIGRTFSLGEEEVIVVGLVGSIRHWGQSQEPGNQVYVPQQRFGGMFRTFRLAIRTDIDPIVMTSALRQAVWSIDPNLPVDPPSTMRQLVATSTAEPRFYTALLIVFASVAISLAAGGIYASLLYLVGQRRREVGIRMAIGARAGDVLRLFVGHGLALTAIGVGLGLVGAVLASRLLTTMVFGITPTDPSTFATVALLLISVAASASYLPARRATQTDPMETLRSD